MWEHVELFDISKDLVPGGVHSPVRSFKGLKSTPRFIESAEGAYLQDVEKKTYIDFCMSFGPLILGHKDEDVKEEAMCALNKGWTYGACEPYSLELAEFIVDNIPFIEQIRFVNSGTEAVMTAIRLARAHTERDKIIKFNGCYHGHTDSMLIKAGSGVQNISETSSKGIPQSIANDTIVFELGDEEQIKTYMKKHGKEVAAIIIEPLPANCGLLPQKKEFLTFLREETTKYNSLLIFDEVITGFRVAFGGMSAKLGIIPDLVTYGKIIGGGFPVGAVAGPKKIMLNLAPVGDVYQAGTLSANPVAMVAGLKTLQKLEPSAYDQLSKYSTNITTILNQWLQKYQNGRYKMFSIVREDSLFWITPKENITRACDIPSDLSEGFSPLFESMLAHGIYLAPSAYEVGFISLAHNNSVCNQLSKRLWNN